jgi:membrane protein
LIYPVNFHTATRIINQAFDAWLKDRALSMGAALAFYTIFSLAPMLILIIWIAGALFGREGSQRALIGQAQSLIGEKGGQAISDMLNASSVGTGVLATIIGIAGFVIFGTSAFVELQNDLNIIWKTRLPHYSGLVVMMRERFASLALIVAMGFLLLISLVIDAGIAAVSGYLMNYGLGIVVEGINFFLGFVISVLLFALIFKILPSTSIAWRDVWAGSVATAVMFLLGKLVIGAYLGHSNVASSFGAAGTLVIILLWIYYSAQIMLFGAELTKAYADLHGSRAGDARAPQ